MVLEVRSPFNQSLIKTIALHDANQAQAMLQKARAAFDDRDNWLNQKQRHDLLIKLAQLVEEEADDFAMLIATEGGKPLTDAVVEVNRAIAGIKYAAQAIDTIMSGQEVPMGDANKKASTHYEPIGVVLAISAFNHPLNLIVHQVVPAIAVGCPVIVKPALTTPLNCIRLVALIHKSGLPKEWCQICICDDEIAESLATSEHINFLTFIGSANVGWMLKSKLAPGVRCTLEHGGVAPVIIDKTADLDSAIPSLTKGGFYHAGQVCVSSQRVYVHESIIDEVADLLVKKAESLKVGDPTNSETDIGPLILAQEVDRVDEWVQKVENTKILTGGKKLSDTTYAPTIILNPPQNLEVSTQEIFAPVMCLYSYQEHKTAIKAANSLEFAFQAAIYSQDQVVIDDCSALLDASSVIVNDHSAFRVDWMPFGGRKHSGYGVGGIGYAMRDMTQVKMVVVSC